MTWTFILKEEPLYQICSSEIIILIDSNHYN